MAGFKELIVWQRAFSLAVEIYRIVKSFPSYEMYGLSQQIQRSSVSIPSNIAEGYGRFYEKEYKKFLSIAYGSLCELETQYMLAIDLNYIERNEKIENLTKEVGSMLYRMIKPASKQK